MVDMVMKKDWRTRWEEWKAKFLCSFLGHRGPTIRSGLPTIALPFNRSQFKKDARYLIRRCSRFRCATEFSTPLDIIG